MAAHPGDRSDGGDAWRRGGPSEPGGQRCREHRAHRLDGQPAVLRPCRAPGPAWYGPAKAASVYVNDLAQTLGRYGIRANAISPGSTMFQGGTWADVRHNDPQLWDVLRARVPVPPAGDGHERVPWVVAFVASLRRLAGSTARTSSSTAATTRASTKCRRVPGLERRGRDPPGRLAVEFEARGFDSMWVPEHSHIPTGPVAVPRRRPAPLRLLAHDGPFISLAMAAGVRITPRWRPGSVSSSNTRSWTSPGTWPASTRSRAVG